jgi:hypothetical protein
MYKVKTAQRVLLTLSLLLTLVLAGCDVNINLGTGGPTATPAVPPLPDSATSLPATLTPVPSAPTAPSTSTTEPATPVPPTSTPSPPPPVPPTSAAEPEPQRIQFAPGATSATVTGHVAAYGAQVYVLRALEVQTMTADLLSPATDVLLEIWGKDGTVLKRHVDGETSWTGTLPRTQDYFIKVVSFGSAVNYTLTVSIPPLEPEPTRIQFAAGATTATVTGHVAGGGSDLYVLRALAGQTMDVAVLSPASDLLLEIWGQDGTPLKHAAVDGLSWAGVLPATQDYFISVISGGSAADYTLTVTIPPPAAEPEAERIQFAAGAISATVAGHVAAYGADLYVLRAMAGQTMEVELISPASDVVLEIWGADGTPLLRHVTGETYWTGVLPFTQDYFVKVVSFGSAVDYTLTVTIPPP